MYAQHFSLVLYRHYRDKDGVGSLKVLTVSRRHTRHLNRVAKNKFVARFVQMLQVPCK